MFAAVNIFAQHERQIVETSPLARALLTNDTALQWIDALGIGTNINVTNIGDLTVTTNLSLPLGASVGAFWTSTDSSGDGAWTNNGFSLTNLNATNLTGNISTFGVTANINPGLYPKGATYNSGSDFPVPLIAGASYYFNRSDLSVIDSGGPHWTNSGIFTAVGTNLTFGGIGTYGQPVKDQVWMITNYVAGTFVGDFSRYPINAQILTNLTNVVISGPSPHFIYQQTNIPATYSQGTPIFANFIPGGNPTFNDALIIACDDLLPNGYADIAFGYFGGGLNTDPTNFVTSGGIGVSSYNGNWGTPWLNQSNYGVWNPGALTVCTVGGTAFIVCGDYVGQTLNGDIPEFFISSNGYHVMITDQSSGSTNYFDFNRTNSVLNIPYGGLVIGASNNAQFVYIEGTNGGREPVFANYNNGSNSLDLVTASDTNGGLAAIEFGYTSNPFSAPVQVAAIGISSPKSFYSQPYTGTSNYGMYTPGNLYFQTDGGEPWVFSSVGIPGVASMPIGQIPEFYMASNHYGMHITDWYTGSTNYFNFNRTNASFSAPFGSIASLTNSAVITLAGTVTATNGLISEAANAPVLIQPSGITNAFGVNGIAFVTCTNGSWTNFNSLGTAVLTNTAITGTNIPVPVQAGGYLKAAAAGVMSGTLVPF